MGLQSFFWKISIKKKPIREEKAREVTIVVLIILAGITLNAVIGENGIIFQAKDTKNLVDNETGYDNQQLASLQNELKDNQLYSGIGIVPGTDQGGSSEGGENGTSGNHSGSQGNNPGHLVNNNQGGSSVGGENAQKPEIRVIEGEQVAAAFYRSNITVQILTQDKTQKIKYILTTTVESINNDLYPNGLIRELDIENGGTLTFTQDGEYTITAYSYDTYGEKSAPTVMWLKKETNIETNKGITLTPKGIKGENDWYTSNISVHVLGTDAGSTKVTYRVTGRVYEKGTIGDYEYEAGEITPREIEVANGTTLKVAVDGEYTITAYTYDDGNNRISTSAPLVIKRDATRPKITSFTGEQVIGQGFRLNVEVEDKASKLIASPYTYYYKEATSDTYNIPEQLAASTKLYAGLTQSKTYDMYVVVEDQAGNKTSSDVISKPALWVASGTAGETATEGARSYYRSNIDLKLTGQDSINVDISKVTYQVIGTTTSEGNIDGETVGTAVAMNEEEKETTNKGKVVGLQADGNWTVKVHTYNKEGKKVSTNILEVTRDTELPRVTSFKTESTAISKEQINGTVDGAIWGVSGPATNGTYTYYLGEISQGTKTSNIHTYTGINMNTCSTIKVVLKDRAGNEENYTPTKKKYFLRHLVSEGDLIDIDLGRWTKTVPKPNSFGGFGGHMENTPLCSGSSTGAWVILGINDNSIRLATTGTPLLLHIEKCSSAPYASIKDAADEWLKNNTSNNTVYTTFETKLLGNNAQMVRSEGSPTDATGFVYKDKCPRCLSPLPYIDSGYYYGNRCMGYDVFPENLLTYRVAYFSSASTSTCSNCGSDVMRSYSNPSWNNYNIYRRLEGDLGFRLGTTIGDEYMLTR